MEELFFNEARGTLVSISTYNCNSCAAELRVSESVIHEALKVHLTLEELKLLRKATKRAYKSAKGKQIRREHNTYECIDREYWT